MGMRASTVRHLGGAWRQGRLLHMVTVVAALLAAAPAESEEPPGRSRPNEIRDLARASHHEVTRWNFERCRRLSLTPQVRLEGGVSGDLVPEDSQVVGVLKGGTVIHGSHAWDGKGPTPPWLSGLLSRAAASDEILVVRPDIAVSWPDLSRCLTKFAAYGAGHLGIGTWTYPDARERMLFGKWDGAGAAPDGADLLQLDWGFSTKGWRVQISGPRSKPVEFDLDAEEVSDASGRHPDGLNSLNASWDEMRESLRRALGRRRGVEIRSEPPRAVPALCIVTLIDVLREIGLKYPIVVTRTGTFSCTQTKNSRLPHGAYWVRRESLGPTSPWPGWIRVPDVTCLGTWPRLAPPSVWVSLGGDNSIHGLGSKWQSPDAVMVSVRQEVARSPGPKRAGIRADGAASWKSILALLEAARRLPALPVDLAVRKWPDCRTYWFPLHVVERDRGATRRFLVEGHGSRLRLASGDEYLEIPDLETANASSSGMRAANGDWARILASLPMCPPNGAAEIWLGAEGKLLSVAQVATLLVILRRLGYQRVQFDESGPAILLASP